MTTLDTLAAATATADVNVEQPDEGPAGDFGLILLGNLRFLDRATAMGASVGKGCFQDFIDPIGRRRRTMAVAAVSRPAFTSGLFRLGLGRAFGEGRGLAFGLTLG